MRCETGRWRYTIMERQGTLFGDGSAVTVPCDICLLIYKNVYSEIYTCLRTCVHRFINSFIHALIYAYIYTPLITLHTQGHGYPYPNTNTGVWIPPHPHKSKGAWVCPHPPTNTGAWVPYSHPHKHKGIGTSLSSQTQAPLPTHTLFIYAFPRSLPNSLPSPFSSSSFLILVPLHFLSFPTSPFPLRLAVSSFPSPVPVIILASPFYFLLFLFSSFFPFLFPSISLFLLLISHLSLYLFHALFHIAVFDNEKRYSLQ